MIPRPFHAVVPFLLASWLAGLARQSPAAPAPEDREPPVVTPGQAGSPPSDAIVLFDGQNLSRWKSPNGEDAKWLVADGFMEVNGTGSILTREDFADVQLHVEWATPETVESSGQSRGNSGVYLQGRHEIQVLDSHNNPTYYTGQAGAYYGNFPPLVNASLKPGEWQTFDILFHAPRPATAETEAVPGSLTVLHNGVLIQDHVPVKGSAAAPSGEGVPKGPIVLQDHGNPVRYRNIWIRRLGG